MDTNGVHIRDKIELTPQLINSFPLAAIRNNQVRKLMFIGREVIFKGGTTQIDDFDVDIIADTLNVEGDSKLLAKALDDAAVNTPGRSGPQVSIFCRDLRGIRVSAQGGQGGGGLAYAEGEVALGTDGKAAEECIKNQHGAYKCWIDMIIPPGRGVQGKPGIKGGSGGQIRLSYVNDFISGGFNLGFLESAGGLGGLGGSGGPGGCTMLAPYVDPEIPTNDPLPEDIRRCEGSYQGLQGEQGNYRGPRGEQGNRGLTGDSTPAQPTRLSEVDYWSGVKNFLGAKSQTWAEHRLQAAEYYFRTFDPTAHPTYLGIALADLNAVVQLNPAETRAADYREYILNNLNILGQERNLSLIPDFDHYYQVLANHEPDIRNIFFQASNSLLHEADLGLFKADVQARAAHLNTLLNDPDSELNRDLADANESVTAADKERQAAATQRVRVESQINTLEINLNADPPSEDILFGDGGFKLFAGVALTVIGTAVLPGLGTGAGAVIAGALLSYGKDLVGNQAAVNTVTSILVNSINVEQKIETEIGKLSSGAKGLSDYIPSFEKYLQESQGNTEVAVAKLKDQLKQEWTTAERLVNSFSKIERELSSAQTGDDPRQIQVVSLYRELAALTQQQLQAELRHKQAQLSVRKAQSAINLAQDDLKRLQAIIDLGANYEKVLKTDTLKVIRAAQISQSTLLTFIFRAARALQIFTLSSDSQIKVRYDYGFLHPDVERDYLEELILPADFRSKLLDAILPDGSGAAQPIDSLGYVELLEQYKNPNPANNLVLKERIGVYSFQSSTSPTIYEQAIAQFKASQTLNFMIHPEELWPSRFDEKIASVAIKLTGVTAGPAFSCIIKQGGRTAQRRLPQGNSTSQVVYQVLNPSRDVILMRPDPNDQAGTTYIGEISVTQADDATTLLGCWGRGVAAEWTMEIEAGTGPVNLAQLTDIAVQIEYDGFVKPLPNQSSLGQITHAAGALQPGATAYATVTLMDKAPATGTMVRLTNSNPTLVKVPNVIVPAGLTTATLPIQVAENAANASVTLTATADFTVRTRLYFPPETPTTKKVLSLGTKSGFNSSVLGMAVNSRYVYATHYYSKIENGKESFGPGELVVIDSTTFKEVPNARIPLGYQPRSIAVNSLTKRIYVTNYSQESYSLSILDCTDAAKPKEITQLKLNQVPIDVAVNTKTNRIYVSNPFQRKIHVIDGNTNTELTSIQVGEGLVGLTVDETTNRIYVARTHHSSEPHINAMTVIQVKNNDTHEVLRPITIGTEGTQPRDVAVNPQTNRIYMANLGAPGVPPSVTVLNRITYQAITTVKTIANAHAIAVNPGLNQVYIGTDGGLQIMDGATNMIVSTIPKKAPWGVAVNPIIGQIYAGSAAEGTITQIAAPDLSTLTQWT